MPRYMPSPMLEKKVIGERIQAIRLARELTQEDVAAKIGVGVNTVSRWERGLCEPQGPAKKWLRANWPEVYADSASDPDKTNEHAVEHAESLTGT